MVHRRERAPVVLGGLQAADLCLEATSCELAHVVRLAGALHRRPHGGPGPVDEVAGQVEAALHSVRTGPVPPDSPGLLAWTGLCWLLRGWLLGGGHVRAPPCGGRWT